MNRIAPIQTAEATGKAKDLLTAVQAKLGITPNMTKVMANSPAALEAYLSFSGALAGGALNAQFREQIALTVAQANGCEYCLSAHSAIGKMVKLSDSEIGSARSARSSDAKRDAGLRFAQKIVVTRGEIGDADLAAVLDAGLTQGEIAEIIANVALNVYTNYLNKIAQTEVDFPRVSVSLSTAA